MAAATVAAGQGNPADATHNARRLGGSTSFYMPPLRSAASLKQMVAKKGMAEDVRAVLRDSGIPDTADGVLATLAAATSSISGGSCDEAMPADGTVVACDFQPGSTLRWMAYRPNARKGDRTPGRPTASDGRQCRSRLSRVTNDYKIDIRVADGVRQPVARRQGDRCEAVDAPSTGCAIRRQCPERDGQGRQQGLERVRRASVAINGQPAGELTAPSWRFSSDKPVTTRSRRLTQRVTGSVARRSVRVEVSAGAATPRRRTDARRDVLHPVKGAYQITSTRRAAPERAVSLPRSATCVTTRARRSARR
jgi:hypothetical protein